MRPFGVAGLQLDLPMRGNADRIEAETAAAERVYPWIDTIVLGELSWFGSRDGDIAFRAYAPGSRLSEPLERLGPLVYPSAGLSREGQGG